MVKPGECVVEGVDLLLLWFFCPYYEYIYSLSSFILFFSSLLAIEYY